MAHILAPRRILFLSSQQRVNSVPRAAPPLSHSLHHLSDTPLCLLPVQRQSLATSTAFYQLAYSPSLGELQFVVVDAQ